MATSVAGLPLTSRVRLKMDTFAGISMEAKPSRVACHSEPPEPRSGAGRSRNPIPNALLALSQRDSSSSLRLRSGQTSRLGMTQRYLRLLRRVLLHIRGRLLRHIALRRGGRGGGRRGGGRRGGREVRLVEHGLGGVLDRVDRFLQLL